MYRYASSGDIYEGQYKAGKKVRRLATTSDQHCYTDSTASHNARTRAGGSWDVPVREHRRAFRGPIQGWTARRPWAFLLR